MTTETTSAGLPLNSFRRHEWLRIAPVLLLAALLATLPLILHGPSCGHDFTFHLQSWLDAEAQLRHGTPLPHWTYTAAWNAGEPRFVFYPPLSWMLGAGLTGVLPFTAAPVVFTWIALAAAGLTMYRLARDYTAPGASLLAAAVYFAGPYAMFTAFERTAYGELLAAVWLPLLLRAALQARLSVAGIALPLALLWLTNAPAAVMGSYTFTLVVLCRGLYNASNAAPRHRRIVASAAGTTSATLSTNQPDQAEGPVPLLLRAAAGAALGCLLPAFYLLPAAYERRWVQISMAIIPNMRIEDNFLFGHTGDGPHDAVLHTASLLATALLAACALVLLLAAVGRRSPKRLASPTQSRLALTPSCRPERDGLAGSRSGDTPVFQDAGSSDDCGQKGEQKLPSFTTSRSNFEQGSTFRQDESIQNPLTILAILAATLAFLLTPASRLLWQYLPELTFLQFPWRLLMVLSLVLATALALLLTQLRLLPATILCLAAALASGLAAQHTFRQACEVNDAPARRLALFATYHGVGPTDEYTPADADNDVLRSDDPAFWIARDPAAFAPGTVPNPAATIVNYDVPPPVEQTLAGLAPAHLHLRLPAPVVLILNLRAYPAWRLRRNGVALAPIARDDGLLAVPLPAGDSRVDLDWRTTPDQVAGVLASLAAAITLAVLWLAGRRARVD